LLQFVDRPLLQSIDQPGDGPAEPFQQSNTQDRSLQCASHQSVEQSGSLPATDQSSLHVSELLDFSAELSFPDMSVNLDLQTSFTFSDISTTKSRLTSTPVQLSMPSSGLDLLTSEATMQQLDVVSKAIPGPFSLMLEEADCQWQHCSQAKGDATGFQQFTAHQQIAGSLLQTMNNCQQTAASTKTCYILHRDQSVAASQPEAHIVVQSKTAITDLCESQLGHLSAQNTAAITETACTNTTQHSSLTTVVSGNKRAKGPANNETTNKSIQRSSATKSKKQSRVTTKNTKKRQVKTRSCRRPRRKGITSTTNSTSAAPLVSVREIPSGSDDSALLSSDDECIESTNARTRLIPGNTEAVEGDNRQNKKPTCSKKERKEQYCWKSNKLSKTQDSVAFTGTGHIMTENQEHLQHPIDFFQFF